MMRSGEEKVTNGEGNEATGWEEVAELASQATEENQELERGDSGMKTEHQETEGWPEALVNMRENWGNLERTQGVFGPKTEMVPYEYGVIGENMTFDEFAKFGDAAYELGHFSEEAYNELLYNKGSELQEKGLCLWTSFATAVRRYNVIKHLSELPENPKFYFSTDLEKASLALHSGRLEGWSANGELPEGFDGQKLHMAYDLDGERVASSDMVTFVIDDSIVQDDDFDLATRFPTIRGVKLEPEHQMVVAKNNRVYDRLRSETKVNEYFKGSDISIVRRKEWLRSQGLIETEADDEEGHKEYRRKLIDEAVAKVNKKEVKEFVGGFLENVDSQELVRLLDLSKKDYQQGAREAVDYFAGMLGVGYLDLKFENEKGNTLGKHLGIGGMIRLNERQLKRHPKRMINVVAHEVFHEYQQALERQYSEGKLAEDSQEARRAELYAFCSDHGDLVNSSDWFYRHQVLEEEAFAFGYGVEKKLRRELWRKRLGRDGGR